MVDRGDRRVDPAVCRLREPHGVGARRDLLRAEISRMLHWCLTESHKPEGSFKVSDLDDTLGDAYECGVDFLQETGYFNRRNRFWTTREFPDAKVVHNRIESKLNQLGLHDPGLKDAYETLESGK